jgi:hypothetical protein
VPTDQHRHGSYPQPPTRRQQWLDSNVSLLLHSLKKAQPQSLGLRSTHESAPSTIRIQRCSSPSCGNMRGAASSSAAYVSRYFDDRPLPLSVSLDQVAKVASRIEQMSDRKLLPREGSKSVPTRGSTEHRSTCQTVYSRHYFLLADHLPRIGILCNGLRRL